VPAYGETNRIPPLRSLLEKGATARNGSFEWDARGRPVVNQAKRVGSLIRRCVLEVYSLQGTFSGGPLRMIVADDGSTLSYIEHLAFPDGAEVSRQGAISALAAPELADSDADLVVVGANLLLRRLYTRRGFRIVPKWIRLFLPTEEDPDSRFARPDVAGPVRKHFRQTLRRIEEGGFECEVTTDLKWFDRFYRDMYQPYTVQRHGELAIVHPYRKMKRTFLRGAGIIVHKDEEPVGGAVVFRSGSTLCLPHMGVLGGDVEMVKQGAGSAIDYFAMKLAHSAGCSYMNFGHTRAFLSNGVLRYKLNWQAEVREDDDAVADFAMAAPRLTEHARRFLTAHPAFHITDQGLLVSQC